MKLILRACLLVAFANSTFADRVYGEFLRPQFHFTPTANWMNDPGGLVFYAGEYHVFYEHNFFGNEWANTSWGHAVSRDLVRWENLPFAFRAENDVMIVSGSVVVDPNNSSGFGKSGKPPMVALYTERDVKKLQQKQQLAFSNDRGRTWQKYPGTLGLDLNEKGVREGLRDPKVFWYPETQRWIATVASPAERKVRFYSSTDFKEWKPLSDFGPVGSIEGTWECPDLFTLPVKDEANRKKWVLAVSVSTGAPMGGSGTQYFVGEFNGTQFRLDPSFPKSQPEFIPEPDVFVDFERTNYAGWKTTGNAFGSAPACVKMGNPQKVEGFRGTKFVNSFLEGDKPVGTLTSPEFEIASDYASFLIGGGRYLARTGLNLLVDGRIARTATGDNAERLEWKSWNIRDLRGKRGRLEIVDQETNAWGHIALDNILFADVPASPPTHPALWADYGPDFTAGASWNDLSRNDGRRRVWLGWMSNWKYANDIPTSPWRGAMTIPREMMLRHTSNGYRLLQEPIRELQSLREDPRQLRNASPSQVNEWFHENRMIGGPCEIEVLIQPTTPYVSFSFELLRTTNQATVVRCDTKRRVLSLDRTRSGQKDFHSAFGGIYEAPLPDGQIHLRFFIDNSSIELFADGGASS